MILTIAHTKGGVGKTTTAVQIATYLKAVKHIENVWLIDGDQQRSALHSATNRNNDTNNEPLACSSLISGKELLGQLRSQKKLYDEIIIDIGAKDSAALRAALLESDVLLIPTMPRAYEMYAMADLIGIIKEAKELGAHFITKIYINCADSQGTANDEAEDFIKSCEDIEFVPINVKRRKSFAMASAFGLSVFEMKPRDEKACNEIHDLVNKIYNF